MMDRRFAVAAWTAFSMGITLLAGCGDSDSAENGTDATNSSVTTDESGSPADGTEPEQKPAEWELSSQPTNTANGTEAKEKTSDWEISLQPTDKAGYDTVLKKHVGKVVLVDFWGSWCGPCRKAFPHTVELSRKYRDDGLRIVSLAIEIDLETGPEDALKFLKENDAALIDNLVSTYEYDTSFKEFKVEALPVYHIYDREGNLAKAFDSADNVDKETAFTHEDVEAAVREALGLPAENKDNADRKDDAKEDNAAEDAE